MTDRETTVTDALEDRMTNLLQNSHRVLHPLWNYILTDFIPILRWTERNCNSSRVLQVIQRLLKLPPLSFALMAFTGLFLGLKKCLKLAPRLTTNLLAVAYPTIVSLKSLEQKDSANWMTYWCVYGWSTLIDHVTVSMDDPIKSYYIPKMLFFYWMSSKGGSSVFYDFIISRVMKKRVQDESDKNVNFQNKTLEDVMDDVMDDSILESVQKSDDECTVSDHEMEHEDVISVDETLQSNESEQVLNQSEMQLKGTKDFKTDFNLNVPTITITGTLDKAPEAAE